jgi:hypothetical protein
MFTNTFRDKTAVCDHGASGIPASIAQQDRHSDDLQKQLESSTQALFTLDSINIAYLLRGFASFNLGKHRLRTTIN